MQMKLKDLSIVFVGDAGQGKRLEKAVESFGWRISIVTEMMPALAEYVFYVPDLVILGDFPESDLARSVYLHLRSIDARPILALNHSPNALKFMHVNSLSFIKLIDRDSDPKALVEAITELVNSYRKALARQHTRQRPDEEGSVLRKFSLKGSSLARIVKLKRSGGCPA